MTYTLVGDQFVNNETIQDDDTNAIDVVGTPHDNGNGLISTQGRSTTFPQNRLHLEGEIVQILDDGVVANYYLLSFDGADESNPIEVSDTLASGEKTGTCVAITYTTSATGTMTYILDDAQFADDDEITGGGNTIDVNGTPETTGQVVASGVVVGIAGTYHIGLAFTSELKPTKLDIEGMGLVLTKKITKAIISFYNTLEGKYGLTTSTLYPIPFSTTLFTGIKELPFKGQYEREGDIIIQQTQPLPMLTRGLVLDVGVHLK